jgi:hypothetical protein
MKSTIITSGASVLVLAACSSAEPSAPVDPSSPTGTASGSSSTAPSASTAPKAPCAPPGSKANEKGVGAFCDAKTPCSGDTFCTGDFGAPEGARFCSKQCATDAECGAGATCYKETRGAGCVTIACSPGK